MGMKKSERKQQAGATLLELLAFLGIAAIVAVGAISMFRAAQTTAQANDVIAQINGMRSTIETLYQTQASFLGLSSADIIASKAVPANLRVSAGQIFNGFGGTIGFNGPPDTYLITYTKVPVDVCIKVIARTLKNWRDITINPVGGYPATVRGGPAWWARQAFRYQSACRHGIQVRRVRCPNISEQGLPCAAQSSFTSFLTY